MTFVAVAGERECPPSGSPEPYPHRSASRNLDIS